MRTVEVPLTPQEADIISLKASRLGYGLRDFIKLLVSWEALDLTHTERSAFPTYHMSQRAEKNLQKALREYANGESVELESIDQLDEIVESA